jgi:hypothetical protein
VTRYGSEIGQEDGRMVWEVKNTSEYVLDEDAVITMKELILNNGLE